MPPDDSIQAALEHLARSLAANLPWLGPLAKIKLYPTRGDPLPLPMPGCRPAAADDTADRVRLPPTSHSPDYCAVRWHGEAYTFTPTQAAVVRQLWEAWADGSPEVRQETLLEAADSTAGRLRDLFRGHPAWGNLIVPAAKGMYRLAASE
jgi:hypothetical protein